MRAIAIYAACGLAIGVAALLLDAPPRELLWALLGGALVGLILAVGGHSGSRRVGGRASMDLGRLFLTAPWWSSVHLLAWAIALGALVYALPERSLTLRSLDDVFATPERLRVLLVFIELLYAQALQIALSGLRIRSRSGAR